jgi:protein-S-isoprenylcysteine O-methyltransferase Ste14
VRATVDNPVALATLVAWVALELALRVRDVASGRGGTAQDRGTRSLIAMAIGASMALTGVIAAKLRHDHGLWLPGKGGTGLLVAGLVVMWTGLLVRVAAVIALGAAFRTTVEVEAGQQLVERGPYRVVRHPSYTGLVLITTGYGVVSGVWPSLLIAILMPLAVLIWRIKVEEEALLSAMGSTYERYKRRTKRLVPGVW